MRVIFLGTPEFAVKSLDAITHSKHELVAVVAQPDKPSERGNKIVFSPVKEYAIKNGLPLFQFPKISRDGIIDLKALSPDIMVTSAYGQILSQEVLDIAKFGVINVHASLLPKYRGASPIQTAILNGDSETGITIMKTEIGLDTGDIIAQVKTPINENETTGELSERLSEIGAKLLLEVLDDFETNNVKYTKQEQIYATTTKKIGKDDCIINWEKSTREIKNLIHGANPNPIARTLFGNDTAKIYHAKEMDFELNSECEKLAPGTILPVSSSKNGVYVKTGDGGIEIVDMQLPGGKVLPAKVLMNGRKINAYDCFKNVIKI